MEYCLTGGNFTGVCQNYELGCVPAHTPIARVALCRSAAVLCSEGIQIFTVRDEDTAKLSESARVSAAAAAVSNADSSNADAYR